MITGDTLSKRESRGGPRLRIVQSSQKDEPLIFILSTTNSKQSISVLRVEM